MDNLENTDPVEAADVTAAQGESDAETQPAETTEEATNEAETEGEAVASNPWDNDPKFKGKTPEDIYNAYQESQKAIGANSQKAEIANIIQEKYGLTPEQFKAQIEQQDQQVRQSRYKDNPLAPVLDEVSELKQIVQRQEQEKALANEERELDKFIETNPEYKSVRDKILKLGLNLETDKSYEDIARDYFGESRAQGQTDAYKKIETKKMTQATGVQSAPNRKFTAEELDKMSSAELEAILPHADTSNRLY